jgi:hypothetical protein
MDRGVNVRDDDGRLDLVEPLVVADVGVGGRCESEDCGGQTGGDDRGKPEILHDLHFSLCFTGLMSFEPVCTV